jgi:hypothetical protein
MRDRRLIAQIEMPIQLGVPLPPLAGAVDASFLAVLPYSS